MSDTRHNFKISEEEKMRAEDAFETSTKQYTFWTAFKDLFLTSNKFLTHRFVGFFYLVQYMSTIILLTFHYDLFKKTPLSWTLPLTGWIQAIIAIFTFKFLPTGKDNAQGYYSDKRTINFRFLAENTYFSGLMLFQCSYAFTNFFEEYVPIPIHILLVFLPYVIIRPFFPKTSLGNSRNTEAQYSDSNRNFLWTISLLSKMFYVWAKHFNGYYLNYLLFLGMIKSNKEAIYSIHWLLLAGQWATTPAMFLNTLKYKKMIGPKFALGAYAISFPFIVLTLMYLLYQYRIHSWVAWIVMVGVPINFFPKSWYAQQIYQMIVMLTLINAHQTIPDPYTGIIGSFPFANEVKNIRSTEDNLMQCNVSEHSN